MGSLCGLANVAEDAEPLTKAAGGLQWTIPKSADDAMIVDQRPNSALRPEPYPFGMGQPVLQGTNIGVMKPAGEYS